MARMDLGAALRFARESDPAAIPEILTNAASEFGATDLVLYLVDFGQSMLEPLPDRAAHAELPTTEEVGTTMAGRAFIDQQVVSVERDGGFRVWVPLLEGSDRTGVVALSVPAVNAGVHEACEELGLLAGYLIAAHARCTDVYNLHRRRRSMSLAASMQWDLLPPLVLKTELIDVAGLVEPAYDVGGDCFDYAANGPVFDFAIMDAMGHGLGSAMISGLAMGAYRHGRREAHSLDAIHQSLTQTIMGQYDGATFATGVLGRIDTASGLLSWTNAGHPRPLLIRGGKVIGELEGAPTPPWGVIDRSPAVATEALEPGDSLLLYTDGVVEARSAEGQVYGVEHLIDLAQRIASDLVRPEEIVRQLVGSVLDHQPAQLADDATILLVRWAGSSPD